ncbi:uncharacterized protein LOC141619595 isoform X2 [Silene latifolia]|uniref:uncharacterized protein LOC141619595 isoform X2 n=1 Tax=Silene latifolia TaxID=37657 RepID=UPI003D77E6B1
MSRYDYSGTYGKPVSVVSYDVGPGTRTYVTRVEERVQQVCRPSAMGYAYYSAIKAEKEGRPREVDNFITKILDEVNGSTVSTTTTRSFEPVRDLYGLPAKGNPTKDGRRGYYVEYTYVGSRNYGDPYGQQNDYGVPNQSDNTRLKSETPRDYQPPKTRWETTSRPIYGTPPYNPPRVEYHSSKSYGEEPESPRDYGYPNNELKSEMAKDYGVPYNQWDTSSVKPVSPKAYEGSDDQWSRPLKPISVHQPPYSRSLDNQGDYSPVKPYSSDGYGTLDSEKGGSPNNRWGNSPSKPIYQTRPYEDNIGDRDGYRGNSSSLKPQSPNNYGVSDNQGGRSSSPNYGQQTSASMKPQSREGSADPKNYRGRSPSPEYEHPPRNNLVGGVASDKWGNSPLKTQSPRDYGTRDNQWDMPSSPAANKGDGTPRGREVKLESPRAYEVPSDQKERSVSPGYEHPPRNGIGAIPSNTWSNSPRDNQWGNPSSPVASKNDGTPDDRQVKLGSPKDQKGRSVSPGYEHPPRNEILGSRAPSNRWDSPSLKVQIPRDHGSPVNQVGSPSSPVYNAYNEQKNVQPNVAVRNGVPATGNRPNVTNNAYNPEPKGDYGGNSTTKPSSGYQPSPLSQATSQTKYSVYSAPVSQVVTMKPGVVDNMEAQRRYGNVGAPSKSYSYIDKEEHGKPVITSRDALKKYNGSFF